MTSAMKLSEPHLARKFAHHRLTQTISKWGETEFNGNESSRWVTLHDVLKHVTLMVSSTLYPSSVSQFMGINMALSPYFRPSSILVTGLQTDAANINAATNAE